MATKIRLARHGRKKRAFYHIVVADSRAPRDGKFIEKIGTYNPKNDPAIIELQFDKALSWLQKGASPTDTARTILSNEGVLLKDHLLRGVAKGALTQEQAEEKFQTWLADKRAKDQAAKDKKARNAEISKNKLFEAETKVNQARAEALAKKQAELAAQERAAQAAEEASEPVAEVQQEVQSEAENTATEPAAE